MKCDVMLLVKGAHFLHQIQIWTLKKSTVLVTPVYHVFSRKSFTQNTEKDARTDFIVL